MYGHPQKGFMPGYKVQKQRGRKTDLAKYLAKQSDLFEIQLRIEKGRAA
jgi:hypothetical protein